MNKKLLAILGAVVVVGAAIALSLNGGFLQGKIQKETAFKITLAKTPVSQTLLSNAKDVKVATWQFIPKSNLEIQDMHFLFTGTAPANNLGTVALKINNELVGTKANAEKLSFDDLDYIMKSGKRYNVSLFVDVSSNVVSGSNFAYSLRAVKSADVDTGNQMTPQAGPKGPTMTLAANGTLTISLDSSTPNENIVIAGTEVPVSTFKATSTLEAYVIKKLTLTNRYDKTPGDMDNNISSVKISYTNTSGDNEIKTGFLVNGKAYFSGMNMLVPKDSDAKIQISVILNVLMQGGGSATAGEMISIDISPENFEAVAQTSGETMKDPKFQGPALVNFMHVYSSKPVFTLSSNSSSGSKTVSPDDAVFAFDVTNIGKDSVTIKDLEIDIASNGSLDTTPSSSPTAILKEGTTTVMGPTPIEIKDASSGKITFTGDLEIAKGQTRHLVLVVNSQSFIAQSVNDDMVTFSIDSGSSVKGTVTPGDVTWENEGEVVQWLGNVVTTKLNSNTLKY